MLEIHQLNSNSCVIFQEPISGDDKKRLNDYIKKNHIVHIYLITPKGEESTESKSIFTKMKQWHITDTIREFITRTRPKMIEFDVYYKWVNRIVSQNSVENSAYHFEDFRDEQLESKMLQHEKYEREMYRC